MSKLTAYTVELYKADKRIKGGLRTIRAEDFAPSTKDYIDTVVEKFEKLGFVVKLHETYIERKNLMTGAKFLERYDTPYYCSPSSESYYSM